MHLLRVIVSTLEHTTSAVHACWRLRNRGPTCCNAMNTSARSSYFLGRGRRAHQRDAGSAGAGAGAEAETGVDERAFGVARRSGVGGARGGIFVRVCDVHAGAVADASALGGLELVRREADDVDGSQLRGILNRVLG